MKPDWKDAPEWAAWLAMDPCCSWFWYESRPTFSPYGYGWGMNGGRVSLADSKPRERASESLEERPQ